MQRLPCFGHGESVAGEPYRDIAVGPYVVHVGGSQQLLQYLRFAFPQKAGSVFQHRLRIGAVLKTVRGEFIRAGQQHPGAYPARHIQPVAVRACAAPVLRAAETVDVLQPAAAFVVFPIDVVRAAGRQVRRRTAFGAGFHHPHHQLVPIGREGRAQFSFQRAGPYGYQQCLAGFHVYRIGGVRVLCRAGGAGIHVVGNHLQHGLLGRAGVIVPGQVLGIILPDPAPVGHPGEETIGCAQPGQYVAQRKSTLAHPAIEHARDVAVLPVLYSQRVAIFLRVAHVIAAQVVAQHRRRRIPCRHFRLGARAARIGFQYAAQVEPQIALLIGHAVELAKQAEIACAVGFFHHHFQYHPVVDRRGVCRWRGGPIGEAHRTTPLYFPAFGCAACRGHQLAAAAAGHPYHFQVRMHPRVRLYSTGHGAPVFCRAAAVRVVGYLRAGARAGHGREGDRIARAVGLHPRQCDRGTRGQFGHGTYHDEITGALRGVQVSVFVRRQKTKQHGVARKGEGYGLCVESQHLPVIFPGRAVVGLRYAGAAVVGRTVGAVDRPAVRGRNGVSLGASKPRQY